MSLVDVDMYNTTQYYTYSAFGALDSFHPSHCPPTRRVGIKMFE